MEENSLKQAYLWIKEKNIDALITWIESNPKELTDRNEDYFDNWGYLLSEVLDRTDANFIKKLDKSKYVNFYLVYDLEYSLAHTYDIEIFKALNSYTKSWSENNWKSCLEKSVSANNLPLVHHILQVYPYQNKKELTIENQTVINNVFEYCQDNLWDFLKCFTDDFSEESCLKGAIEFGRVEYIDAYLRKYPVALSRRYMNYACACENAVSLQALITHIDRSEPENILNSEWLNKIHELLNELIHHFATTPVRFKAQQFIFKAIKQGKKQVLNYLANHETLNLPQQYDDEFQILIKNLLTVHHEIEDKYKDYASIFDYLSDKNQEQTDKLLEIITVNKIKDTSESPAYEKLMILRKICQMLIDNYHTPYATYQTPLEYALYHSANCIDELIELGSEVTQQAIINARGEVQEQLQKRYDKTMLYQKIHSVIENSEPLLKLETDENSTLEEFEEIKKI
jgi:hypothetical protein